MNAYDLAMLFIFICAGISLIANVGIFGSEFNEGNGVSWMFSGNGEANVFQMGNVILAGGIVALGVFMYGATYRVVGTTPTGTAQGVAYLAFSGIFWTAFLQAYSILYTIQTRLEGFALFTGIFLVAAVLIFIMGLIQLAVGGVKTHG